MAEDFKDTRELMTIFLQRQGYDVIEAADGNKAVEQALNEKPGLILMDIAMPEMTGIEATRIIRDSDGISDTPIVAITAFSAEFITEALAAGCNRVISKPVDFDLLKQLLEEYLPRPALTSNAGSRD